MATNGSFTHQEQYKAPADPSAAAVSGEAVDPSGATNDLSKDEVGWYFVEQYYTTLSKSPDRIHLFYNKRSQFVSGIEAEVANVSVGRQAIQDRIKELDFQETKVRVSNVDSQASSDGIVIQVIGELSNKSAEPKKFVQTFVLAQQPTGYFVLNDMMRYINEEDNTEAAEAPVEAEAPVAEETAAVEAAEEPAAPVDVANEPSVVDAAAVEQKLEQAQTTVDTADVNGDGTTTSAEAETPAIAVEKADPEATARELAEEDAKAAEKPQDPTPTPSEKPAAPAAEPVVHEPVLPPKPMTWASRAAAAAGPRPVIPLPQTAAAPAQSQKAPAAAAAPAAPAVSPKPAESAPQHAANAGSAPAAETKEASAWQTAGAESKRQTRPQSISANPSEKDITQGYVKYVNDKVQEADLRKALEIHGDLTYFDINRQKNCAFVEYKSAEALIAALNSNPHVVSGEQIVVEQRRPKPAPYSGNFAGRGGSQRGRGGFDGNRNGGAQGGARGAFSGQNRGRGGARGRGNAQASAA